MPLDSRWVDHLLRLRQIIDPDQVPVSVMSQALAENPWFSEADIRRSLSGIRSWLEEDSLLHLFASYERPTGPQLRVGVIAAGNLPLVCMHDVLSVLVSGHSLFVKSATQDRILIEWIRQEWVATSSEIGKIFHCGGIIPEIDLLIATGSNNTARHLRTSFGEIPHLIRKNRFSVALLGAWTTEKDLQKLGEDIFTYQGLGCRNVSNVVLLDSFSKTLWEESLRSFPKEKLHPLYVERYLIESVRRRMLKDSFLDAGTILRVPTQDLQYASMGVLYEIELPNLEAWSRLALQHQEQIQCVVGLDIPYGQAQFPAIDDFADGVDTIAWILEQQHNLDVS